MAKDLFSCKITANNIAATLEELRKAKAIALEELGLAAERNAKLEITKLVYDTPQSPSYLRTGRLRGSITYATTKKASSPEAPADGKDGMKPAYAPDADSVIVGTNVEYAPYVEFGTSRMRPRPFLENALNNHTDDYEKIIKNRLT